MLDFTIDDLGRVIEELAAGQELIAERLERIEKKLDSLFNQVPPYEATKTKLPDPIKLPLMSSRKLRFMLEKRDRARAMGKAAEDAQRSA